MRFIDRTGEVRKMYSGLVATIIAYRNNKDIDIQVDNGCIVKNRIYGRYKRGEIKCPLLIEYVNDYAMVSNPNTNSSWLMDVDDLPILSDFLWFLNGKGYIVRRGGVKLHRLIMNAPKGKQVDHINGNRADNRKRNLRICDFYENARNRSIHKNNTSGYKGVSWRRVAGKWHVSIMHNRKRIHLGLYVNKTDAAKAYNEAAIKYHGEFARLNEI